MKHFFLVPIVFMVFLSQQVFAQSDDTVRYILSPNFQPTKSLDVINDGQNNKVCLDKTQNVTGQAWKITRVQGMEGYFRLSPDFQPTKSLDVINDGQNNKVCLALTQNVSGQLWKITAVEGMPDYIRLSPSFQPTKSLDVINDGKNNTVCLDKTQNVSGQVWKLSLYETTPKNSSPSDKLLEISIGKQIWMTQNLNVNKFLNGDPILEAKTDEEFDKAYDNKQPAWCYYNNDPANGKKYGKLYNWYAVNDPRGLAPKGWKIPSDKDWSRLTDFLGSDSSALNKMKFTDFWINDYDGKSYNGTNESGFSGLPGGVRNYTGSFSSIGIRGYWWSSSEHEYDPTNAYARFLFAEIGLEDEGGSLQRLNGKGTFYSVRCLRD